ncbi:hypothetical protein HNQ08_005065 [Deinococcus humi]|uniref:Uncharacterized protein n=1 Tax=Deinococcus humi TaxID=662880 RepID=A0A7W8NFX9_9DEIO|nr:hypothetical protein [Deinococcus humi]
MLQHATWKEAIEHHRGQVPHVRLEPFSLWQDLPQWLPAAANGRKVVRFNAQNSTQSAIMISGSEFSTFRGITTR